MERGGAVSTGFYGLAAVLTFVLTGCFSATNTVRRRHAVEFECPESTVRVTDVGGDTYQASGCGVSAMYVCAGSGDGWAGTNVSGRCIRNSEPRTRP